MIVGRNPDPIHSDGKQVAETRPKTIRSLCKQLHRLPHVSAGIFDGHDIGQFGQSQPGFVGHVYAGTVGDVIDDNRANNRG